MLSSMEHQHLVLVSFLFLFLKIRLSSYTYNFQTTIDVLSNQINRLGNPHDEWVSNRGRHIMLFKIEQFWLVKQKSNI